MEKRKILVFSCIVWARIWLLTAPFIGVLTEIHPLLPLSSFGILSIIGGVATSILSTPRTVAKCQNTVLPSDYVIGRIFKIEKHL